MLSSLSTWVWLPHGGRRPHDGRRELISINNILTAIHMLWLTHALPPKITEKFRNYKEVVIFWLHLCNSALVTLQLLLGKLLIISFLHVYWASSVTPGTCTTPLVKYFAVALGSLLALVDRRFMNRKIIQTNPTCLLFSYLAIKSPDGFSSTSYCGVAQLQKV